MAREEAEIKELTKKLAQNPNSLVFAPLADVYRRLGRFDEAIAICREGLEKNPAYMTARVILGRALMDTDQLDEAAGEFKKIETADPQNIMAHSMMGQIAMRQELFPLAIEAFQKVLALTPDDASAQSMLVDALARANQPGEAKPAVQASHGSEQMGSIKVVDIYLKKGALDEAEEVVREILAADPENPIAKQKLQEIVRRRGPSREELAQEAAQKAHEEQAQNKKKAEDEEETKHKVELARKKIEEEKARVEQARRQADEIEAEKAEKANAALEKSKIEAEKAKALAQKKVEEARRIAEDARHKAEEEKKKAEEARNRAQEEKKRLLEEKELAEKAKLEAQEAAEKEAAEKAKLKAQELAEETAREEEQRQAEEEKKRNAAEKEAQRRAEVEMKKAAETEKRREDAKMSSDDILSVMQADGDDDIIEEEPPTAVKSQGSSGTGASSKDTAAIQPELGKLLLEFNTKNSIEGSVLVSTEGKVLIDLMKTTDLNAIGQMASKIFLNTGKAVDRMQLGALEQIMIAGEDGRQILFVTLKQGVLMAITSASSNLGLLRLAINDLRKKAA